MLPWLTSYQTQLMRLIQTKQLAHGLLIVGPIGIGKSELVQFLANALLCTENDKPCGQCKSCLLQKAGSHSDFLAIDVSGSSIGVDSIRAMSSFMHGKAQQQVNKVVVLEKAHKLTEAAANALLKTLEEPPPNSFIILSTSISETLPATLLSRVQKWPLKAQFGADATSWLKSQTEKNVPDFLLSFCSGGPLKALHLLQTNEADNLKQLLDMLHQYLLGHVTLAALVKQLETSSELTSLLGWFISKQMIATMKNKSAERQLAINQLYSRWCRDEALILGQNKSLALNAFLIELKRLSA